MTKDDFEADFRSTMVARLEPFGFSARNSSLVLFDDLRTVSLVRLGGRMSRVGAISYVVCFRHSFLRDRQERIPTKPPTEVFDYPFKIVPSRVSEPGRLAYSPQNLRFDYDIYNWSSYDDARVRKWMVDLADLMADRILPWTETMTPARAMAAIHEDGEAAWCERMWLDDYGEWLAKANA